MISDKRRREIMRELKEGTKEFAEAWRLASAYGKAGDTKMRGYFMRSVKTKRRKRTPEEKAWVMQLARESLHRLLLREAERREQGLPPIETEYKKPSIH
jgi:hypothetical protein